MLSSYMTPGKVQDWAQTQVPGGMTPSGSFLLSTGSAPPSRLSVQFVIMPFSVVQDNA